MDGQRGNVRAGGGLTGFLRVVPILALLLAATACGDDPGDPVPDAPGDAASDVPADMTPADLPADPAPDGADAPADLPDLTDPGPDPLVDPHGGDPLEDPGPWPSLDLASLCPVAGSPPLGILPEPWRWRGHGGEVSAAGLWPQGASGWWEEAVCRIAERWGRPCAVPGSLPVRLREVALADLQAACALPDPLPPGSYALRIDDDGIDAVAGDVEGWRNASKTLKMLVGNSRDPLPRLTVLDRPAATIRGVGETYYGAPWSRADRLAVLPLLADLKFNTYLYLPKWDLALNLLWKFPWDDDYLAFLRELAVAAWNEGLRPCLGIHAETNVIFSTDDDLQTMAEKFEAAGQAGFDCFVLAFDDTSRDLAFEDRGLVVDKAHGQALFANRLAERLLQGKPDALLGFVPDDYWTEAPGTATDLAYLGQQLSPAWHVAWTGNAIVAASIAVADAEAIAAVLGRPPFLADNHPVVDNSAASGVVNLGPLEAREAGLPAKVFGLVYNPMPLPYASLPGLATDADFAWNDEAYDPDRSLVAVARWLLGPGTGEAQATLSWANLCPYNHASQSPALEADLAAFRAARADGKDGGGEESVLRARLQAYLAVPAAFDPAVAAVPAYAAEVGPWARQLADWGQACLEALDLLAAKDAGGTPDPAAVEALRARADALRQKLPKPTGTLLRDFLDEVLALL